MQNLIMLSLEKDLHATKVEDMVTLIIERHTKKKLLSDTFQGVHFCFVFHLTLIAWSVAK